MLRAWTLILALFGLTVFSASAVAAAVTPLAAPAAAASAVAGIAGSGTSSSAAETPSIPVKLTTEDDLELSGTYWSPRSKRGALAPAALLLHDSGAERDDLKKIAERMWKQGFAVLTVDLRGHGKSVGKDHDWNKSDAKKRDSLWAFATRDVEAAAEWLLGQERVHRTNLNLVAHGCGCALAARHALDDENVRSIALLEPPTACHGFDLATDLRDLGGLPTLILAPNQKGSPTEKMVQEANADFGEHPYVILMATKSQTTVLEDKKTPSKVSSWVKGEALPGGK